MKNLLLLMLIPLFGIAQSPSSLAMKGSITANTGDKMLLLKNMKDAINFQNIHRSYFEYKPLVYDQKLTDEAQQWAAANTADLNYLTRDQVARAEKEADDYGNLEYRNEYAIEINAN